MVDRMHAGKIGVTARCGIGEHGTVLPTVPQPDDDLDEFFRAPVAILMRRQIGEAEVARRSVVLGGDDIPCRTTAADMVQRREAPGNMIGVIERGRGGRDKPDMFRYPRQRSEQDRGIKRVPWPECGGFIKPRLIGKENRIEGAALRSAGNVETLRYQRRHRDCFAAARRHYAVLKVSRWH